MNCFRIQMLETFLETVFTYLHTDKYLELKLICNKWKTSVLNPIFICEWFKRYLEGLKRTPFVVENYINLAFHFNKGLKVRQICHILTKIINNRYYRFVISKFSIYQKVLNLPYWQNLRSFLLIWSLRCSTRQVNFFALRFDEFLSNFQIFSINLCTSVCFEVSSALPSYPF